MERKVIHNATKHTITIYDKDMNAIQYAKPWSKVHIGKGKNVSQLYVSKNGNDTTGPCSFDAFVIYGTGKHTKIKEGLFNRRMYVGAQIGLNLFAVAVVSLFVYIAYALSTTSRVDHKPPTLEYYPKHTVVWR